MKVTSAIPRVINPIFKNNVILEDVGKEERISISLRDIGLLQESHVGGFGPQTICSTSLAAEDFSGWVEMRPQLEVPGNGWPLLKVEVKVRGTGPWPGEGFAADRAMLFEPLALSDQPQPQPDVEQAFAGMVAEAELEAKQETEREAERQAKQEAEREAKLDEGRGFGVPASSAPDPAEIRCIGVSASSAPDPTKTPTPPPTPPRTPTPEPLPAPTPEPLPNPAPATFEGDFQGDLRWQTFHIPESSWGFYDKGELFDTLQEMSARTLARVMQWEFLMRWVMLLG